MIDVSSEDSREGVPGAEGSDAAIAANVFETALSPTTLRAVTLNL